MAIHVEQGVEIGKSLGDIVGAVQGIVQPYKGVEQALRGAIAEDPSLAQKLTDMEFKTPGSTASLFGPHAGAYFANLRPSNDAIIQKTITPFIKKSLTDPDIAKYVGAKEVTGVSPGTVEEDKYKGAIAQATLEAVQGSPELLTAGITRKVTGGGVGTLAEQQMKAGSIARAMEIMKNDSPDIMIDKVLNNKYGPADLNAIFSAPMSKALEFQLRAKLADKHERLARDLEAARIANDQAKVADLTTRLQVNDALLQARVTGLSTPAAFLKLGGASDALVEAFGGVTDAQLAEAQGGQDIAARQFAEKGSVSAYNSIARSLALYQRMKANDASPDDLATLVETMKNVGNPYGFNVLYDEKNGLRVLGPDGRIVNPQNTVTSVGPVKGEKVVTPNLPPRPGAAVVTPTSRSSTVKTKIKVNTSANALPPKPGEKPQSPYMSRNAQVMFASLESMRAGKDPRARARIETEFFEGLKKKAGTNRDAAAIYDEYIKRGIITDEQWSKSSNRRY